LNASVADAIASNTSTLKNFEKFRKVSWTIFNNRFHNAIENTLVNAL